MLDPLTDDSEESSLGIDSCGQDKLGKNMELRSSYPTSGDISHVGSKELTVGYKGHHDGSQL